MTSLVRRFFVMQLFVGLVWFSGNSATAALPEFFGVYASRDGVLTEMVEHPQSRAAISNIEVMGANLLSSLSGISFPDGKVEFIIFLNNVEVGSRVPVRKVSRIIGSANTEIYKLSDEELQMRIAPIPDKGAMASMVRGVPKSELEPGIWAIVVGGKLYDFVIGDKRYADCYVRIVDVMKFPPVHYAPCGEEQKSLPEVSAALAKASIPSISSLPENAGGISLVAEPSTNGDVVPVKINIENPLMAGDVLIVSADGEQALELRTDAHPIMMVSTRLRLRSGKISAYVVRGNGHINSDSKRIQIGTASSGPPSDGNRSVQHKVQSKGDFVKMLFANDMALTGYIREVKIRAADGGTITVKFTPKIAKNPFLSIKSTDVLHPVSVAASL